MRIDVQRQREEQGRIAEQERRRNERIEYERVQNEKRKHAALKLKQFIDEEMVNVVY